MVHQNLVGGCAQTLPSQSIDVSWGVSFPTQPSLPHFPCVLACLRALDSRAPFQREGVRRVEPLQPFQTCEFSGSFDWFHRFQPQGPGFLPSSPLPLSAALQGMLQTPPSRHHCCCQLPELGSCAFGQFCPVLALFSCGKDSVTSALGQLNLGNAVLRACSQVHVFETLACVSVTIMRW